LEGYISHSIIMAFKVTARVALMKGSINSKCSRNNNRCNCKRWLCNSSKRCSGNSNRITNFYNNRPWIQSSQILIIFPNKPIRKYPLCSLLLILSCVPILPRIKHRALSDLPIHLSVKIKRKHMFWGGGVFGGWLCSDW